MGEQVWCLFETRRTPCGDVKTLIGVYDNEDAANQDALNDEGTAQHPNWFVEPWDVDREPVN